MSRKCCTKCQKRRDIKFFWADHSRKDNLSCWCKDCHKNHRKIWPPKHNDPDYLWKWDLRTKYGMTSDDYEKLYLRQRGLCAICKRTTQTAKQRRLDVDHNHDTNQIRGLLCRRCNFLIGYSHDNPQILGRAMDYLLCHA